MIKDLEKKFEVTEDRGSIHVTVFEDDPEKTLMAVRIGLLAAARTLKQGEPLEVKWVDRGHSACQDILISYEQYSFFCTLTIYG